MALRADRRVARLREALRHDEDAPAPGRELSSNLRLIRELAAGGMGDVWVAEHRSLGVEVAVKFLRDCTASGPEALDRFQREAAAAARIKSPHVVQIHDHGIASGDVPYIVMELLEGEDLGRRLRRVGRLELAVTRTIVQHMAKALGRAHAVGVVHRDVKPANVFLCELDGELVVKLLDFGLAKTEAAAAFTSTASGSTLGTPLYMSPEQVVSAKSVDWRTDLWSLAVVVYECLTGRPPFSGETHGALAIAVDRAVFVPPSALLPGLPAALDAWFERALARAPASRFQSAKELGEAFERFAEDKQAQTLSATTREVSQRRRRPAWVVPVAASLGAAGLAVIAAVASANRGASPPRSTAPDTAAASALAADQTARTPHAATGDGPAPQPEERLDPPPAAPAVMAPAGLSGAAPTRSLPRPKAGPVESPHASAASPSAPAPTAAPSPSATGAPSSRRDRGF